MPPTVFVTVGTETYPFDRLVEWVDAWSARSSTDVRCVVQYGTSAPPRRAEGHDYLPFDQVRGLLDSADVVVCHGGTGSVMLARGSGRLPVVVPREGARGEHVDDHQIAFARRLAAMGQVALAEHEDRLGELLDAAIAGDRSFRVDAGQEHVAEAVQRFADLVDDLFRPGEPRE